MGAQTAKLSTAKMLLSKAEGTSRKAQFDLKAIIVHREKLRTDGKILRDSSKFKAKQELANEKTLKSGVVKRKITVVRAEEHHEKQLAKLKLNREAIAEEEKV